MEARKVQTQGQIQAQIAHKFVSGLVSEGKAGEYSSFSKSFPAVINNCGLAQAIAFGFAKKPPLDYMRHLAIVAGFKDQDAMADGCRNADVAEYLRLTRQTLKAATWLKRYSEALLGEVD